MEGSCEQRWHDFFFFLAVHPYTKFLYGWCRNFIFWLCPQGVYDSYAIHHVYIMNPRHPWSVRNMARYTCIGPYIYNYIYIYIYMIYTFEFLMGWMVQNFLVASGMWFCLPVNQNHPKLPTSNIKQQCLSSPAVMDKFFDVQTRNWSNNFSSSGCMVKALFISSISSSVKPSRVRMVDVLGSVAIELWHLMVAFFFMFSPIMELNNVILHLISSYAKTCWNMSKKHHFSIFFLNPGATLWVLPGPGWIRQKQTAAPVVGCFALGGRSRSQEIQTLAEVHISFAQVVSLEKRSVLGSRAKQFFENKNTNTTIYMV